MDIEVGFTNCCYCDVKIVGIACYDNNGMACVTCGTSRIKCSICSAPAFRIIIDEAFIMGMCRACENKAMTKGNNVKPCKKGKKMFGKKK